MMSSPTDDDHDDHDGAINASRTPASRIVATFDDHQQQRQQQQQRRHLLTADFQPSQSFLDHHQQQPLSPSLPQTDKGSNNNDSATGISHPNFTSFPTLQQQQYVQGSDPHFWPSTIPATPTPTATTSMQSTSPSMMMGVGAFGAASVPTDRTFSSSVGTEAVSHSHTYNNDDDDDDDNHPITTTLNTTANTIESSPISSSFTSDHTAASAAIAASVSDPNRMGFPQTPAIREKEQFLVFIKILFKILDQSRQSDRRRQAQRMILDCRRQNQRGNPDYVPLVDAIVPRLRPIIGEPHWRKAHFYLYYYVTKQSRQRRGSSSNGNGVSSELGAPEAPQDSQQQPTQTYAV
eukprot:CAMPEP_0119573532 /NCGR_PEP_ID=MMETSP1352-20130426/45168_1 /TAXON_ID=265584 /ORGANISM="Stauroneis constricta, Strain CCMP1120" /LENGTH=348 /DNA_ID=CAMNT_0007623223 /DNA_START=1681 /DNA_END=2727 /DNA_ORIENTATION=-